MAWVDIEENAPKQRPVQEGSISDGIPKSAAEWVDAGKGAILTYNQEPVTEGVPTVLRNTVNVAEGLTDATLGAGAGVNETFADIIDFFDGDGNAVADWLRQGAKDLRSKQFKEDGVASAVGEKAGELSVSSAAGGATGKAIDSLFGDVLPAVSNKITSSVMNRGRVVDKAQKAATKNLPDEGKAVVRHYAGVTPKPTNIAAISEVINKISPTTAKAIDRYYTTLASTVSDTARANLYRQAVKELKALGFNEEAANKLLSIGTTAKDISTKMVSKELGNKPFNTSKAGAAVGALFNEPGKTVEVPKDAVDAAKVRRVTRPQRRSATVELLGK